MTKRKIYGSPTRKSTKTAISMSFPCTRKGPLFPTWAPLGREGLRLPSPACPYPYYCCCCCYLRRSARGRPENIYGRHTSYTHAHTLSYWTCQHWTYRCTMIRNTVKKWTSRLVGSVPSIPHNCPRFSCFFYVALCITLV